MLGALNALMEALAGLSPSIAVIAPYLLLAGLFTAIAAKLVDSEALFEAGRQACLTGLIVGLLSCLDYLRDPTLLGPIWELRRLHAILLPAAYYERYEQRLSLKQSFMALGWTMAVIFIFIGVFWLMLRGLGIELPLPPWLPTVMVKLDAVLALARLIALTWLFTSLVRLALSAKGGMGLLIGEANEQGRRKTFWFRRMYKPVRPKRNPHVLIVGTTGGGKSNLLKLLIRRALKKPQNVLVVDFTGEYRYLARHGFKVVDARSRCIDVFACDPHTVAEALRVAFPEAGELSAAVVETRLREAGDVGLKGFAETLIKESEQPSIASTTRSALRSIGEKLRVLASEVAGVGLDPRELLKGLKVLSLEGLLHDESKSFIAELTLRVMFGEAPCRPLSLTLVVDEAHRLIPPRGPAVEPIIVRVMREARKYGVKVYAATQSLKDLSEAAVGNFDTVWVAGGLVSTDRDFVARKWGDFVADASSGLTTGYAVDLMDASASRRAARPFTVRVVRIPRFREEPPIATLLRLLGLSRRAPWEAPEEAKPFEQPRRPLKQPRVKVEEPLRAKKPQIEEALRPEELRAEEVPVEEGAALSPRAKVALEEVERRGLVKALLSLGEGKPTKRAYELERLGLAKRVPKGWDLTALGREVYEELRKRQTGRPSPH